MVSLINSILPNITSAVKDTVSNVTHLLTGFNTTSTSASKTASSAISNWWNDVIENFTNEDKINEIKNETTIGKIIDKITGDYSNTDPFDKILHNTENREEDAATTAYDRTSELQQMAQDFNSAEAQKERDWQTEMSNTSYQRAVTDLQAAGLNPILASGNSGASSGSGASASVGANSATMESLSNSTSLNKQMLSLLALLLLKK